MPPRKVCGHGARSEPLTSWHAGLACYLDDTDPGMVFWKENKSESQGVSQSTLGLSHALWAGIPSRSEERYLEKRI